MDEACDEDKRDEAKALVPLGMKYRRTNQSNQRHYLHVANNNDTSWQYY